MLMRKNTLTKWLKLMILGVGICGMILYAAIIPMLGRAMTAQYPEFRACEGPWLALIWLTAVPCYIAMAFAWKIAGNIGADLSFSVANAKLLKWISVLAAGDAALFFAGNIVYWLLDMNHPGIVLLSLMVSFLGVAIAVASAVLSHLVMKAAVLQDQSDLTI